jgi:hypothetical protein
MTDTLGNPRAARDTVTAGAAGRFVMALLGRLVEIAGGIAFAILVIFILLVVFKAAPHDEIYKAFRHVASPLAWKFKRLFTLHSHRKQVAANYGLAAVVYLVVAEIVGRILRRFASPRTSY